MKKTLLLLFSALCFLLFSALIGDDEKQKDSLFGYGGLPKSLTKRVKVLYNEGFITGYSNKMKNPLWTMYRYGNVHGTYNASDFNGWERTREFKVDARTNAGVSHDDYTRSGYDRGHMAPNSGIFQQYGHGAQLETFLMTNICPQRPNLNREVWERLERKVRTEISQNDSVLITFNNGKKQTFEKKVHDVFVVTGPIFSKKPEELKSGIPIPFSFYKILVYQYGYGSTPKAIAFNIPQTAPKDAEIMDYVTTIDEIEELTGFDFFADLSKIKQQNLEGVKRDFNLETLP